MRLEFLFSQARYSMRGFSVWDSRATILSILDILNILSRIDIRADLLKELERQTNALLAISSSPGVDPSILTDTLNKLRSYMEDLKLHSTTMRGDLMENELLKLIRQRASIPGGTCDFDLPAFHYWLTQPAEKRVEVLESWLAQIDHLRQSIELILGLLRESAVNMPRQAQDGFYQQSLETNTPYQLIRVLIPEDAGYYAEISGGKHRFSIRFMLPSNGERAAPCHNTIDFQLSCCAL